MGNMTNVYLYTFSNILKNNKYIFNIFLIFFRFWPNLLGLWLNVFNR